MIVSQVGSHYFIEDDKAKTNFDRIPGGVYHVCFDSNTASFYLKSGAKFKIPDKIYGNSSKYADRIINTFSNRGGGTGVLLSGEKGSGKTMISKMVSNHMVDENIPVLLVSDAYSGVIFNNFLDSITHPVVLFFDEFEKIYHDINSQNHLLTILDGTVSNKRLYLLTCNDKYAVSHHMRNRPGRLFYSLHFDVLDEDFIKEYGEDNLNSNVDELIKVCRMLGGVNFDLLQAIVEESNRYNESPMKSVPWLNAEPRSISEDYSKLQIVYYSVDGKEHELKEKDKYIRGNGHPLYDFEAYVSLSIDHEENPRVFSNYIYSEDLESYDKENELYTFKVTNSNGHEHIYKIKEIHARKRVASIF